MKITNKHGLPQTFLNVLNRSTYTKGKADLSVTELLQPPQLVQLRKRHWEELEEDVTDKIWAIFGTAIHAVLELGADDNHVIEERIHATLNGWDISGAVDLQRLEDGGVVISDYKTVGVWAVMNEKLEWEQQLNMYAWLIESVKKVPVKRLEIIAIIRDWNRRDAKQKESYPQSPVKMLDIPLWPYETRELFIKQRIHHHSNASLATEIGEDYALCTPEEMWEKPTTYAVKKVGNKRATVVCQSEAEAEDKKAELGHGYEIQIRAGERTRCEDFCQVRDFCKQYQQYKEVI